VANGKVTSGEKRKIGLGVRGRWSKSTCKRSAPSKKLYDVSPGNGAEERVKRKAPATNAKGMTGSLGGLRSDVME
jgi:hypothetical protein